MTLHKKSGTWALQLHQLHHPQSASEGLLLLQEASECYLAGNPCPGIFCSCQCIVYLHSKKHPVVHCSGTANESGTSQHDLLFYDNLSACSNLCCLMKPRSQHMRQLGMKGVNDTAQCDSSGQWWHSIFFIKAQSRPPSSGLLRAPRDLRLAGLNIGQME